MTPAAWLVIGEPHLRAVFLEQERAMKQAVEHRGVVKALVLEDDVLDLLQAADIQGAAIAAKGGVMLELIAMLGGGLFRLVPFIVDFFKAKRDAEHEYRMTELQLKIDQARAAQQIDLAHAQAQIAADAGEMKAWADAIAGQATPSGIGWVDAVSSTVRPFLTYYWCVGLYGAAKVIQVLVAVDQHAKLEAFIPILVTEFDRQVIGSMLAFWFVDRALRRAGQA